MSNHRNIKNQYSKSTATVDHEETKEINRVLTKFRKVLN